MGRATKEEAQMVMEVVNTAYKVEMGNEGIAFKSGDRFASLADVHAALPHLWVARIQNEVVGVIGVDVKEDGSADLGPIAVRSPGKGVGTALLAWAESNHPVREERLQDFRRDTIGGCFRRDQLHCGVDQGPGVLGHKARSHVCTQEESQQIVIIGPAKVTNYQIDVAK